MKKTISLKRNEDFLRLYKKGKFYSGKYLVLYVLPNSFNTQHIGITVSKKVGKSVIRNKLRRLIKENYSQYEEIIKEYYDMVFVVRRNDVLPSYYDIKKEMKYLFKKHDLLKVENFPC